MGPDKRRIRSALLLLKRKLQFRGVRVLELHEKHGCHFHVITNKRYAIRKIQEFKERYGFGRIDVREARDTSTAIRYLCKYLVKPRPGCLRRAWLWSAFGDIERTRVRDIVTDTPMRVSRPSRTCWLNGGGTSDLSEGLDSKQILIGLVRRRRQSISLVLIPRT